MAKAKALPKKANKYRFQCLAEHMSVSKAEEAIKESKLKGLHATVRKDDIFTGMIHIKFIATTKDSRKLQDAVWEQNGGAFCEMTKGKKHG